MWWWCSFTKWKNIQVKRSSEFSSARNGRGREATQSRKPYMCSSRHRCLISWKKWVTVSRFACYHPLLFMRIQNVQWNIRMGLMADCPGPGGITPSHCCAAFSHPATFPWQHQWKKKLLNMKGLFFLCRIHGFICQDNKITFYNNIWHQFFRVSGHLQFNLKSCNSTNSQKSNGYDYHMDKRCDLCRTGTESRVWVGPWPLCSFDLPLHNVCF